MIRRAVRIKKRTLVVSGIALLVVGLLATAVLAAGLRLSGHPDVTGFVIRSGAQASVLLGSGLTLEAPEGANLLTDASFEPLLFRKQLTAFNGDERSLSIPSDQVGAGPKDRAFFEGAFVRVLTQTEEGLLEKQTARVSRLGINHVDDLTSVQAAEALAQGRAVLGFARFGDRAYAVGTEGLLLRDVTGPDLERLDTPVQASLTGIDANDSGLVACSDQGALLFSKDGLHWQVQQAHKPVPLRAVALSEDYGAVAVGDGGQLLVGTADRLSQLRPLTRSDLTDVTYGEAGFLAVGRDNTLLASENGLVWQAVQGPLADDWLAVSWQDGVYVVAGQQGGLLLSRDGRQFETPPTPFPGRGCADLVLLSQDQWLVLDRDGVFHTSSDSGQSWQASEPQGGSSHTVFRLGQDRILSADRSGQIHVAQLVASLTLDRPLAQGRFEAGDLVFLEKRQAEPIGRPWESDEDTPQSPWVFYGAGTARKTDEDHAPQAGQGCLKLQADPWSEDAAIVSQVIDSSQLAAVGGHDVLQLSLWLRQEGLADRSVHVWLTGPFDQLGTTFTNVSSTWKKYTYALAIPARPGGYAGQTIRLNIGIDQGTVWLDRVFVSRLQETPDQLPLAVYEELGDIAPQVLRLPMLGIGSRLVPAENWAQNQYTDTAFWDQDQRLQQSSVSLHAALKLAVDHKAAPWLVIDSYATEVEVMHLLEYLAAPVTEPYGNIRQALGMAVPWMTQIPKLYVEFCDTDGVWTTDRMRSDAVNRLLQTIVDSPHYQQIRSHVIFVDGMAYEDGIMLSKADYHASALNDSPGDQPGLDTGALLAAYWDRIPRNPDKPVRDFPELMRAAHLPEGTSRLAEALDLLLFDLGRQSGLVNLARPSDEKHRVLWQASAAILAQTVRGQPLLIDRLERQDVEQGMDDKLRAYGFISDQAHSLILLNLSDQTQTCQLVTELPFKGASMAKYDEDGILLSRQTLNRPGGRITLLPGGAIVIHKTQDP